MGKQEVYRTMLTLNKFSLCVAVLGLLVAIVIGILQLQRSKQSRQQPPTVKTTIVHTQDKTGSQSSQVVSPVRKATSESHATQTPAKSAEPVQAVQVKEATGSSTTTPKSKRLKVRTIPKSTTTVPPKESDSSK
jgi:cytoskeletal protein RodZ